MLTSFEIRGCWCRSLDVWWMYRSYHVYSTEWTMLFDYLGPRLGWMSSILLDANTCLAHLGILGFISMKFIH